MSKAKTPDPECWSASWCAEHGPDVRVDEDGCCVTCGNGALGPGAEQASRDRRRLAKALRDRRALAKALWIAACRESHEGRRIDTDHCEAKGECALCEIVAALRAHGPRRKRA